GVAHRDCRAGRRHAAEAGGPRLSRGGATRRRLPHRAPRVSRRPHRDPRRGAGPRARNAAERGPIGLSAVFSRRGRRSMIRGRISHSLGSPPMLVRNCWYIAAWADEIGAEPLARRICGDPLVLFRDRENRAAALVDRCCHRAAPLHMGSIVEEGIQCGYHGLVFDGSGRCVAVPGQSRIPEDACVRSYPIVEKDQLVWVWMGEAAKADPSPIVDFPYHNDAATWPNKHDVYPIKGNYMLMVDNLMDLTHLGYLHAKTVGGNPVAHVEAEMKTTRTAKGLKFVRWLRNSVPPPTYVKAAGFTGRVDRWQEFEFVAPSSVLQWTGATDADVGASEGGLEGGFQF